MIDVILITVLVFASFIFGIVSADSPRLEECKKQHNVYECEMIAVPKKPDQTESQQED